MEKILIFMVFLCPLIFFHELGHFLFARLFGVRVEVFSLGFGPKLFKRKIKDTEYAFSLIPLGGYVKMFGDDPFGKDVVPEEEKKFAFNHKSKWARFWIVFGGPLANFILTFALFSSLAFFGEKVPAPKFGFIAPASELHNLGMRTGDTIIKINDSDVFSFLDFPVHGENDILNSITVDRNGQKIFFGLNFSFKKFSEEFGKQERTYRRPFFVNKENKTFALSLHRDSIDWNRSLDEIVVSKTKSFFLIPMVERTSDIEKSRFDYSIAEEFIVPEITAGSITEDQLIFQALYDKGLFPEDLQVKSIDTGTAAEKAGLQKGDLIVKIDGRPLFGFNFLREIIQGTAEGSSRKIEFYRNGELKTADVIPLVRKIGEEMIRVIGVYSAVEYIPLKLVQSPPRGPIESAILGARRTYDAIVKTLASFQKLIVGDSSLKNLGGPIAIGKAATESLEISISYFFGLMALISVNLGVINLFPIPVLDGGHILFIFLETINRGPLSRRKMEIAQQFGLSVLVLLIFAAVINDLYRVLF